MTLSVTKGTNLLEPAGLAYRRGFSNPRRRSLHRFLRPLPIPWENPFFAAFRRPAEKHSKLASDRGQQHDVDRAGRSSHFAVGHYTAN
jgi:hypothetical protein